MGMAPYDPFSRNCLTEKHRHQYFIVDGVSLSIMMIAVLAEDVITPQPLTGYVKK
jgi:hypothetical protein